MPISPEDKEELLKDEEFVAKILAKQKPPEPDRQQQKPKWQRFLETSGGTALITVLLGGLLGQLITWSFQQNQKEREFQQKWLEARGAQALVSYKEYLDQEQQLMKRAYELVGNSVTGSDGILDLMRPGFFESTGAEQRVGLEKRYNAVSLEWGGEREKLQLLMSYYHKGQKDVLTGWEDLSVAVEDYLGCAGREYFAFKKARGRGGPKKESPAAAASPADEDGEEAPLPCEEERDGVDASIAEFNNKLESGRKYPWEGWNSPGELRSALESKATPTPATTPPIIPASTPAPEKGETPAPPR